MNADSMKEDYKERCSWCCDNGIMQKYHDEEWGIPVHDDKQHFEYLMMEVMQCGLNWNMMLKKREIFRKCFSDFDYEAVSQYDETKIASILETEGMIRSRRKIEAVILDAKKFIEIQKEFGSFDTYIWSFTNGKTIIYRTGDHVTSAESDALSRDLKKRGFKYLGSTTVYAHMQASGLVNDHSPNCWMYEKLMNNIVYK